MITRTSVACILVLACSQSTDKPTADQPTTHESAETKPTHAAAQAAQAALDPESVPFFNRRSFEGLLVGGQPTPGELRQAAKVGVKTIVNLRTPKEPGVSEEVALAAELGLTYISIPVAGGEGLTVAAAKQLDKALAEANGPVIVHCGSGNRVGALFALRANKLQGKSAKEALAIGKASGLTGLEQVVRNRLERSREN